MIGYEDKVFFIEYVFLFALFSFAAAFYFLVTKPKKKMDLYLVNELKFNTNKYDELKEEILTILNKLPSETERHILKKETINHFSDLINIYFDNGFFIKKRFVCEEINFNEENEKYKKELALERFIKSTLFDLEDRIRDFKNEKTNIDSFIQEINKFNREKEIIILKYTELQKEKINGNQ